jgi:hypothetical protein
MPLTAPALGITDSANGGGGAATLVGGDAGATNVVKVAQFAGAIGPLTWTTAGTRTGPGTVSFTLSAAGMYLFAVQSTLAAETVWSSPAYARISDSADSIHEQLQQAALARILSLALPIPGITVERLKLPPGARNINLNNPSCLLLTFDQEEDYRGGTNAHDDTALPLHVVIVTGDLNTPEPDSTITTCRQLVRRAFREWRSGVPTHYRTDIERGVVLAQAAEGKTLEASSLLLKFYVREPRGLGV